MFTARYKLSLRIRFRLVVCLSARKPVFNPRPVPVTSKVDKVTLGQVSLPVLPFSPVSIKLPMPHSHLRLHIALTNGRSLKIFQKTFFFFRKFGRFGERFTLTFV